MTAARRDWSFLLSRRWVSYFILLVVFAIACGFLSVWQFDRRDERVTENHRIEANFDAEPTPIAEVLPALDSYDAQNEWRPVALHGEYLVDSQMLVRSRPRDGMPGFELLAPFRLDSGEVFIVDRGWIPTGSTQDYPDHVPLPPSGELTVSARLKPGEPQIPGKSAPEGQMATIHLPTIAERLGQPTYTGAYGLLRDESVTAETGKLVPKPEESEGNHLSYAFQWIIFAVIAAAGLIYGLREEFRERNASDPKVRAALERERERARRRGPTDADIEDAILDGELH